MFIIESSTSLPDATLNVIKIFGKFTVCSKQPSLFCCPIKHQNEKGISNEASRMALFTLQPFMKYTPLKPKAYYQELSRHPPGYSKENHNNPQSMDFASTISRKYVRSDTDDCSLFICYATAKQDVLQCNLIISYYNSYTTVSPCAG